MTSPPGPKKAYKNIDFLKSEEARTIRLLLQRKLLTERIQQQRDLQRMSDIQKFAFSLREVLDHLPQ